MCIKAWSQGKEVFSDYTIYQHIENPLLKIKDLINTYSKNKINIDIEGQDYCLPMINDYGEEEYRLIIWQNNQLIYARTYTTNVEFLANIILTYPRNGELYDFQVSRVD